MNNKDKALVLRILKNLRDKYKYSQSMWRSDGYSAHSGLCTCLAYVYTSSKYINLFSKYLQENTNNKTGYLFVDSKREKITKKKSSYYLWKPYYMKPRLVWLNKHINILTKELENAKV